MGILLCLKKPNINKSQINLLNTPLPQHHNPHPPSSFSFPALSHLPASTKEQAKTGNQRLHGHTGYWGAAPLLSGWASIMGSILPPSHHQYSNDYSATRYSVITSLLLPGHRTARSAAWGRNCSMPKLSWTVCLKSPPEHVQYTGKERHMSTKRNSFQGLKWNWKQQGGTEWKLNGWLMPDNQRWVPEMQMRRRAGNMHFECEKQL